MQISENLEIVNRSLYIRSINSLVLSDVHIGYEEELNRRGIFIPRHHFKDTIDLIQDTFKKLGRHLDLIIINGDLKHEFGRISGQEWREILKFLDLLKRHCDKIILIRGNHDPVLGPIAGKRNIEVVETFSKGKIFFCHGHKIPQSKEYKTARLLIIGNEHPAVSIKDGVRKETYKCFLKGTFQKKEMIVLPSINPVTIGTDILKEKFISPFMKTNLDDFEVYISDGEIYNFGKVRHL